MIHRFILKSILTLRNFFKSKLIWGSIFCLSAPYWIAYPLSRPAEENKNAFASPIYASYLQQLHIPDSLAASLDSSKRPREQHSALVNQMRILASESPLEPFFTNFIRRLFLGTNQTESFQHFLYSFVAPPGEEDFFSYLATTQKNLKEMPHFNGLRHFSKIEDELLHGNLPFLLSNVASEGFQTQLLRFGQPTLGTSTWIGRLVAPAISPEFLLFLKLQPSHLYVNLMKRTGMEGPSTQVIEKLENEVPHLFVISLDKNSDFYWQDLKTYPVLMETVHFKQLFTAQMSAANGNFFWSKHLDKTAWNRELEKIADTIHDTFFDQKALLNQEERQDFIELTYLAILDNLVLKWHPASMNITCKQCMDRGPSLAILWLFQKKLLTRSETAALLLAPPLIIHNRPSHTSRINRFISAASRSTNKVL